VDAAPRERGFLLAITCVALATNLLTAVRYPAVWGDEIHLADPAVSFVLGNGLASSVWVKQGIHEIFAGNAPLYPVLLSWWLSAFGVSATAVRSMNYVLVSLLAGVVATRDGENLPGRVRSAAESVTRAVGGAWIPEVPDLAAGSVSPEPGLFRLARELRDENYPIRIYRRAR
jgi:hypothetical protein